MLAVSVRLGQGFLGFAVRAADDLCLRVALQCLPSFVVHSHQLNIYVMARSQGVRECLSEWHDAVSSFPEMLNETLIRAR